LKDDLTVATEEHCGSKGKLVMVCGAARSGTTMLDLMLGNSDDAFSTGEIDAYFRPYRSHHFNPVCSCGESSCKVWQDFLDVEESQIHNRILARPEYNFVIDSSKDLRWVLDSNVWARRNGHNCINVLIWKDPIDLAYSHWKRGNGVKYYRRAFLVYYERFLKLELPFISLNYGQLVAEPRAMLEKLCLRLGMECDENRMNFWSKEHHYYFGSAGTGRQVSDGVAKVSAKREFPKAFLTEYEEESKWSETSQRFNSIIYRLIEHDVARSSLPVASHRKYLVKPLWYYRHSLKSLVRKRFPETMPVAD
jgi:hypothetical protein